MSKFSRGLMLGLGTSLLGMFAAAPAVLAEDFYKGKTLTILIGHNPGGSYDGYAQLAALHLGKHIAGNPNVIVEHRPGGGGTKAGAYFFSKAPTDGTMISLLPDSMNHSQLLEPKRARWDMRKVKYLGRMSTAHTVFGVRADTGVKTPADLMKATNLKAGCTGKTSPSAWGPLMVNNLEGTKFTLVCGYRGSGPFMLAMERGEVNMISMNWGTWEAKLMDKVKSKEYLPLMQIGVKRNKLIPDIPLLQEAIGNEKSKKIYRWLGITSDIGRSPFGAPNMPMERVNELRAAFDKMVKDPAFIADVKKRGFPYDPAPWSEIEELQKEAFAVDAETVKLAGEAMSIGFKGGGCVTCEGKKKADKKG